jgi:hypothetical protein
MGSASARSGPLRDGGGPPPCYRSAMTRLALPLAFSSLLALTVTGCASTTSAEPAHDGHHHEHGDHEERGHGHGQHHRKLSAGMEAFHDVLAPVYHMDKGAARDDKTCAAVPSMKDAAAKVAAEPSGDASSWKARSDALTASVTALETACGAPGKGEVGVKLEAVHDAFHALMK